MIEGKDRARLLEFSLAKGHPIEVTNVLTNQKTHYLPSGKQPLS
jgi:hypothetical protein